MNHHNSVALIVTAHDGLYSRIAMYFCVGGGRSYSLLGMCATCKYSVCVHT